jgi:hypothetical protein
VSRDRTSNRLAAFAAAVLAAGSSSSFAADAITTQERQLADYAFATRLGSGVYATAEGRTIQIYRIPLAVSLREAEPGRVGFRITFPMTIGIYDFLVQDLPASGLPDNLDTLSLVPGLELPLFAAENWLLTPYVEAGHVENRSGATDATVWGVGSRSLASFRAAGFDLSLGNALAYTGAEPKGPGPRDDLLTFETALEWRHDTGTEARGHALDWTMYAAQYLLHDDSDSSLTVDDFDAGWDDQYEIGATFGTKEKVKVWKIPIPRVGLGYRFGEGLSVFRIVFGAPTWSLTR